MSDNIVVLDETTQAEATGRLLEWHPGEVASAVRVDAGPVYKNARIERLLVHTAGYALDVVEVATTDGAAHRIDWVYHNAGTVTSPLGLTKYAAFPAVNGYQYLTETQATVTGAAWDATFAQTDCGVRLHMLGDDGTAVVLGHGLGQDLTVPVPFAMARRSGHATRFVTVIEPFRETSQVRRVRLVRPDVVEVVSAAGTDEISVAPEKFGFRRTMATGQTP